jgi:hypothetical protein
MNEKRLNHLGFELIEKRTPQVGILNMDCHTQKGTPNDIPFNGGSYGQAKMHRPRWLIRILGTIGSLLLLLFGFTSSSNAQSGASVSGTVNDGTGAVISSVRVLLKNVDTGVEQSTQTNGSGSYAFISVIPGRYSLEWTRDGFATAKEANVSLGVNQAALLNVSLVPGSVQQTVVVSADSSTQQTTNARNCNNRLSLCALQSISRYDWLRCV